MKSASSGLHALLATRQFFVVDLYQITFTNGTVLRYCGGDKDIAWNGYNWLSGALSGPFFVRKGSGARCRWQIGVEVDSLQLEIIPGESRIGNTPWLAAMKEGMFDGAELTLYRAFMPQYGDTSATGAVTLFAGRIADIEARRGYATLTINSHLELLNQKMPRNLYQAGCVNTLFDTACGLNKTVHNVNVVALAGSERHRVLVTLSQPSGYFDLGVLECTSGGNAGMGRSVRKYTQAVPSILELTAAFISTPQAGDAFVLRPGCDKQLGTCIQKFNNMANFRGFPYIPRNTTAV